MSEQTCNELATIQTLLQEYGMSWTEEGHKQDFNEILEICPNGHKHHLTIEAKKIDLAHQKGQGFFVKDGWVSLIA